MENIVKVVKYLAFCICWISINYFIRLCALIQYLLIFYVFINKELGESYTIILELLNFIFTFKKTYLTFVQCLMWTV